MGPSRVRELMTENPVTLGLGDSLAEAHDLMETHHVRHIPILDQDGALVGLLSERDLLRAVGPTLADLPVGARHQVLAQTPVEDVMVADPESVGPEDDVRAAAQTLLENKFGCLPVLDDAPGVAGILTESDFVRYFAEST